MGENEEGAKKEAKNRDNNEINRASKSFDITFHPTRVFHFLFVGNVDDINRNIIGPRYRKAWV